MWPLLLVENQFYGKLAPKIAAEKGMKIGSIVKTKEQDSNLQLIGYRRKMA